MEKKSLIGVLFLLLSISIPVVSAFVYESAQQSVTQTVVEVATITLKDPALGNIDEGETKTYTKVGGGGDVELATLGDAISLTTTKASVYLHLNSDLDDLTDYSTFNIVVKFSAVEGSTYAVGDTACTLSLASADYSSIDLDVAGTWKFDFELTTTASSVSTDSLATVTIIVTAQST